MKRMTPRILIAGGALLLLLSASSLAGDQPKTTSMKGKVVRSDTKQPIANAVIVLLDEKKSDKQDNSIDTKTDDQGNYSFPKRRRWHIHCFYSRVVSHAGRRTRPTTNGENG